MQHYEEAKTRTQQIQRGDPWSGKQHHGKSEAKEIIR